MANKDLASLGDMYGKMLSKFKYDNHLTNESHDNAFNPKSKFKVVGDGPHVDGVDCDVEDEYEHDNKLTDHQPDDEDCPCKVVAIKKVKISSTDEDEEDFFEEENQKSKEKYLNKHMSKSKFDSIVKKVLRENFGQDDTELDALGLDDATPDAEFDFGDEGGDEGGDEVSFTLPRDVAQQLVDVLQAVLGGEEDLGDEGDDFGDEDLGDDLDLDMGDEGVDEDEMDMYDEDEMDYDEDEEGQPTQKGKGNIGKFHQPGSGKAPDKKKAFQAKSNKVGGKANPKGGKAKTDVTDEQGTKVGAPAYNKLQGKDNKVPGNVKVGDLFK